MNTLHNTKALQLAKELEVVSWSAAQDEAAIMIRLQHAAIVTLRKALANTRKALVSRIDDELVMKVLEDTKEFE